MGSVTIRSFLPSDAGAAAALLAEARAAAAGAFPALLPREGVTAGPELAVAGKTGALALDGEGRARGFLLLRSNKDELWGDSLEIGAEDWALAPGEAPETLALLYAAAAERTEPLPARHVLRSLALPSLWEPWFRLGFGLEQVYAYAPLAALESGYEARGIEIRRAGPGDEEELEELSELIARLQGRGPVWAGAPTAYLESLRTGFRGLAADGEALVFLALEGGRVQGYQAWFPGGHRPFGAEPPASVELGVAASRPEARGRGIGRALTARCAAEARRAGFDLAFTDWRAANPLASAFWTARGFAAHSYRLVRRFDPRALAEGRDLGA